jgi:acetyl-CoA synthetase
MNLKINSFEQYQEHYKNRVSDPSAFWDGIAQTFRWQKPYDKACEWDFQKPDVKWFLGGVVNITENALDRHLPKRANQPAIIWEPNDPNSKHAILTYQELSDRVCQFANALKSK